MIFCAAVSCKITSPSPLIVALVHRAFNNTLLPAKFNAFACCFFSPTEPILYGRTQQRHITRDVGFLSYSASARVTVFAKGAYFTEYGEEFWEAEVRENLLRFEIHTRKISVTFCGSFIPHCSKSTTTFNSYCIQCTISGSQNYIIISFSVVDSWKAWTDSQHWNQ